MKPILLKDMIEKKIGRGEDSQPISFYNEYLVVLGVFDGMGGAGAAEHPSDFSTEAGEHKTKAYIGSRIIRQSILDAISENAEIALNDNFQDVLKEIITQRYKAEKDKFPPKSKIGLRSSLIKDYPTTLALICLSKESNEYIVDSYWAGDSRNYLWTSEGLFQVSKDDLQGNLDPLQNLKDDAPMSNCIHADGPFYINHKKIKIDCKEKIILISATDGCFAYFDSPMDFELCLIDTLRKSSNETEWKERLDDIFKDVTGDDFSFSIGCIGFENFGEVKKKFKKVRSSLQHYLQTRNNYIDLFNNKKKMEALIKSKKEILLTEVDELWPSYKNNYYKYFIEKP